MRVGIVGAGAIGLSIATHLAAAGVETLISSTQKPEGLAPTARQLGPTAVAVTRQDAAQAEIVIVAVRWQDHKAALSDLPAWRGRIVVDAMNPIVPPGFSVADLGGRMSSELIGDLTPDARLVKAFNTLPPPILGSNPRHAGGHRVVVMSGDDAGAKRDVGQLIERLGFAPIDLGSLAAGGRLQQFPGGVFAALNLIRMA